MWDELVTVMMALIVVVLLPIGFLYLRRRWLTGQGGVFDCAMLMSADGPDTGWSLGWARYRGEQLQWYRAFSLSVRPKIRLLRTATEFDTTRAATTSEASVLYDESIVVMVRDDAVHLDRALAMSRESAMAFISWLEAAPPGSRRHRS